MGDGIITLRESTLQQISKQHPSELTHWELVPQHLKADVLDPKIALLNSKIQSGLYDIFLNIGWAVEASVCWFGASFIFALAISSIIWLDEGEEAGDDFSSYLETSAIISGAFGAVAGVYVLCDSNTSFIAAKIGKLIFSKQTLVAEKEKPVIFSMGNASETAPLLSNTHDNGAGAFAPS